ncbi:sensor histidine kinase [Formosa sp. PL04]|uniref:sensor histidine kinase n=1 Tax=Formosa sp. PL04 TaxID=3081755 RepID=UPI00298107D6|nr:histidine kinase [Formosa sp. PL04]MDW5289881.1 histidine kinase [Formosa sp. PL04]
MSTPHFIIKQLGRLCLHILFWCGVLLFYTYFFGSGSNDMSYVLSFSLFLMPITIATTYVFIYKLIPEYLMLKKYVLFGLYSLYTFIISSYLIILSIFYGLIYLSHFEYNNMAPVSQNLLFVMIGVYLVTTIVSAFKLLKLNLKQVENTSKLEHKILETQLKLKEQELQYLKMQIHPHFLFNTLNTMYGFSLKKADETPEMILKLSNLLDYLLYQIDKPFVLLTDEINHIQDYIALESLRFNKTLDIKFNIENISENTKIAPMLFLPFIENSFKHGILKQGVLHIKIDLSFKDHTIYFYIENSSGLNSDIKSGIGLENIKKRLDMLYKEAYTLSILNSDSTFKVHLTLKTEDAFANQ